MFYSRISEPTAYQIIFKTPSPIGRYRSLSLPSLSLRTGLLANVSHGGDLSYSAVARRTMALSPPVPALTTTFAPSPSCLIDYFKLPYQGSALTCLDAQNSSSQCFFTHLGPATSTSDCLPSGYVPTSSFYYSPGICPSGYELACHSTAGPETRGTCCPRSASLLRYDPGVSDAASPALGKNIPADL